MKIILFSLMILSTMIAPSLFAKECKNDQTFVKSHNRQMNGKKIKVAAHCRNLTDIEKKWWPIIRRGSEIPMKQIEVESDTKDQLVRVIRELPKWTNKIGINQIFISSKASTSSVNLMNQEVTLQSSLVRDSAALRRVLIHEYSHLYYLTLDPIKRVRFESAAGWIQLDGKWVLSPREEILIQDSVDSMDEHFANSVELFESDELMMKQRNPLLYNVIKEILND